MTILLKKFILLLIILLSLTGGANALPSFKEVRKSYNKSDCMLLDRYGEPLYELRTDNQTRRLDWTNLSDISPALLLAVLFAEDRRFFEHEGVDYLSMGAAFLRGMEGDAMRGASTITMQLASMLNSDLQPKKGRRNIFQKTSQIAEARGLEKQWSKRDILEAYLNLVSFRGELAGINAASRGLYGKAPHGLNRSESLVLASLIRSPNARAAEIFTRACILKKVLGWETEESEIGASIKPALGSSFPKPASDLAPHAARLLIKKTSSGNIRCTIDGRLQRFILERLNDQLGSLSRQSVSEGAALVILNKSGEVLAYASFTNDPGRNRYVDGVRAKRQAGSTLKPFLYGLAFEKKILTPASILEDAPLDMAVQSGIYRPNNYEGDFKGMVTARSALASSLNIPAVRTLYLTGLEAFLAKLRRLGIKGLNESGNYYGLSMALGSVDVSLWELTNAYRCLANEGLLSEPSFKFKADTTVRQKRIYSRESAFLISDILSDREARSATFGLENPLATRFWTAVKTGTSKDMRDNWCVGYSREYTAGVWVGNFSGEAMRNVSGISGAAPVWIEIMNRLRNEKHRPRNQKTPLIVKKDINFQNSVDRPRAEYFIKGTEPGNALQRTGQLNRRIVYPPDGAILAIDPDIPQDLQRVFFLSHPGDKNSRWQLNNKPVSETGMNGQSWDPLPGLHTLSLCDDEGRVIDTVRFEVRGDIRKRHD